MVNKKIPRIKVLCPNNHEIITRKFTKIQCRTCGLRFDIPTEKPEEITN